MTNNKEAEVNEMENEETEDKSNEKGFVQGEIMFTIYENAAEHFFFFFIKIDDTN